jgi:carbamate kinase
VDRLQRSAPLLVVALGGNALLRRAAPAAGAVQIENVRFAAQRIAQLARTHRLVVAHGNGPQLGLLVRQGGTRGRAGPTALDRLGAQTEGLIGYLLEQEIANRLPAGRSVATLLTRVEVDRDDIAFGQPDLPIGPTRSAAQRDDLALRHRDWHWRQVEGGFRRVVPSPQPRRIVELPAVRALVEQGIVVICAGGGGIPVARSASGDALEGVDAIIDKDLAAGLLARELDADRLVIATDVDAVCLHWSVAALREPIRQASPVLLRQHTFDAATIGPKVQAACEFAEATGRTAVIGALKDLDALVSDDAGTLVSVGYAEMG